MKKLKLKNSIYVLKESEEIYQAIFTGNRKILKFKTDPLVRDLIDELKIEVSSNDLVNKLINKYEKDDIKKGINSLKHYGLLRVYDKNIRVNKYSKQIDFIDELTNSWEETLSLQEKIETSTISVFGIGGIGTWIVNGLYQIGVGKIKISDPDIVSLTNLNRQLFFREDDIGRYKVDVIKERIKDANIKSFKKKVSPDSDLEDIISDSDFIVNCADNPSVAETSRIIDEYANKYDIPYCVAGGYNMHLGMIGPLIIPGETASFQDFIEYQKDNDPLKNFEKIKDIEQTGNLGPIAGAVANIQVMEIFKYLIGKGEHNINRFAEIDFMNFDIDWKCWEEQ